MLKGVGGLFTVLNDAGDAPLSGRRINVRARGNLRGDDRLLPGDLVETEVEGSGEVFSSGTGAELAGAAIRSVLPRKNCFIRPPMANLDRLFIILAATRPDPSELIIDKLLSVCEYYSVEPVIVIGKCELDREKAKYFSDLYTKVGYKTFVLSCAEGEGVAEFADFVKTELPGTLSAFAGASGAGKTTLMNALFPSLELRSGEVSRKTGRGRHTTRAVELYETDLGAGKFLIADTPGFSAIDFVSYDFLPFEALPDTMRDFLPYYKDCRWPDCSHTLERDCGVVMAVERGDVAKSRHESYCENYSLLKIKSKKWD